MEKEGRKREVRGRRGKTKEEREREREGNSPTFSILL